MPSVFLCANILTVFKKILNYWNRGHLPTNQISSMNIGVTVLKWVSDVTNEVSGVTAIHDCVEHHVDTLTEAFDSEIVNGLV